MYDAIAYGVMLADSGRTSAYARALAQRIRPGSIVLDIGTGVGILALLACRAGAARVYAVEPTGAIDVARAAAAASGFGDRIVPVHAMSTAVTLPEPADGVVADIHGVLPLFRQSVASLVDARTRLLKPDGWIIPGRETIWAAVVSSSTGREQRDAWNTEYGFDFSAARQLAANTRRGVRLKAEDLKVAPQCWGVLDWREIVEPRLDGVLSWIVEHEAIGDGLAVWFDAELAPGVTLSNSPASGEEHVYGQAFFPWPEAVSLAPGDDVRVRLRADLVGDDYIWTWKTDVTRPAWGPAKAAFRQSSLHAGFLSPELFRRRAHTFVADPGDDARIDRRILELMDRRMSLGEIATDLVATFPDAFKDWNAALGRAGDLASRYSR